MLCGLSEVIDATLRETDSFTTPQNKIWEREAVPDRHLSFASPSLALNRDLG